MVLNADVRLGCGLRLDLAAARFARSVLRIYAAERGAPAGLKLRLVRTEVSRGKPPVVTRRGRCLTIEARW